VASEQRLHPTSVLFAFGRSAKAFALPGLLLLVTARRSSGGPGGTFGGLPVNWELWMMLLLIPSAILALTRYLSFRIRYEGTELVIRSGILFKNERHIPYARIQNLDAVQNILHRVFGVLEVRVETGGGREPEARISVLPASAFAEMRRRVVEGRSIAATERVADPSAPPLVERRTLLRLPLAELVLFGFLENRGMVLIGAAYGVCWEFGLFEGFWGRIFDDSYTPFMLANFARTVARTGTVPMTSVLVLLAGLVGLLAAVRLVSMVWAAIRLHGFHLTRAGNDLHIEFGLLTRVATTIPLRRVQSLTIRHSPLSRLAGRSSVRVQTAGGNNPEQGKDKGEREWLAPVIRVTELPALLKELVPDLDLATLVWHRPHRHAFRRAVKPALVLVVLMTAIPAVAVTWWTFATLPLTVPWAVLAVRKRVDCLGWASNDEVIAFRSGWLWQCLTVARVAKIQAVMAVESPFDRRTAMARIRVDTAGSTQRSHRIDIPYLPREDARALQCGLAAGAARTTFSIR
jgi:putative membrane protein